MHLRTRGEKLEPTENPTKAGPGSHKARQDNNQRITVQYAYHLEKEGYYEDSAYPRLLHLLVKKGANLLDAENVKAMIAKQPWKKLNKTTGGSRL